MEIKPHNSFVLSLPSHLVCFLFISILHYNLVFDCKFIWKSHVNFSFIELIFVMMKDTYLLTYEDLSTDESMVPYYGRHSCKPFIRAKPSRFGYKLWVLASGTGVPYKIEIYQGRTNQGSDQPLGKRFVKNVTLQPRDSGQLAQ